MEPMSSVPHESITPADVFEAQTLFAQAHQAAEIAREEHVDIEQQLSELRRAYAEQIATEQDGGKPRYSNSERRDTALRQRMAADWPDLLEQEQRAALRKRMAQAELERAESMLKARLAALRYETELLRLEAVTAEAAALPRINRFAR